MNESRVAKVALGAVVVGFLAWCGWLRVPLVDDAAISIAYGRTLFSGHGFRLTEHSQVVEAFSNPLWTVILGLSVPLRVSPTTLATRLGYALAALSLVGVALWGPSARSERSLRFEDALAPAFACTVTAFGYWACGGLETGLLSMLLALSGALWLRESRAQKGVWSAVTLGLVCLTRPEGALYALSAAGLYCALRRPLLARPTRRELAWCAALAALVGAWLAARWWIFASLVANTYYAKRDGDFLPWSYLRTFARENFALMAAMGCALFLARREGGRRAALAGVWLLAGAAFIVKFRGDWMPEWRFIAPLAPCMGALVAAGVAGVRGRRASAVAMALAGGMLVVAGQRAAVRSRQLRGVQEVTFAGVYKDARVLGRQLRAWGFRRPLLGIPDIGGLAFAIPEAEEMDTAMLADWSLARHVRSRPMMDDYLRFEGPPTVIDVHGPSGFLAELPELMGQYVPIDSVAPELHLNPGFYVLRGVSATSDPRCPGGRERVVAMGAQELAAMIEARMREGDPVAALRLWRCAWSYQPDERLPTRPWRVSVSRRAMEESRRREAARDEVAALRYSSLATVLGGHDAHDRRRTEALRERVFARSATTR